MTWKVGNFSSFIYKWPASNRETKLSESVLDFAGKGQECSPGALVAGREVSAGRVCPARHLLPRGGFPAGRPLSTSWGDGLGLATSRSVGSGPLSVQSQITALLTPITEK